MKEPTFEEIAKDSLYKQAIYLYEWSLLLYYYWLIIHWENVDFPGDYNDKVRQGIKERADRQFKVDAESIYKDHNSHFPNDFDKEAAATFFIASRYPDKRDETERKDENSFNWLSIEHRCLSILYENFDLFQKKLGRGDSMKRKCLLLYLLGGE